MNSSISYSKDQTLSKKPVFRKNLLKNIMFFYASLVFATPVSLAIAEIKFADRVGVATDILLFILYIAVTSIIIALSVFLHINRHQTYEEAGRENSKAQLIMFSMKGEKVGLYLRFGVVLLCVCSIVYEILNVLTLKMTYECMRNSEIAMACSKVLFFIVQTIFLLKYHSIVILKHTRIISFCLYSIIFIDITIWEMASIQKISKSVNHGSADDKNYVCKNKYMEKAAMHFLPTVSEYSVIGAAITYEILKRLGMPSMIETLEHDEESHCSQRIERSITGVVIGSLIVLATAALTTFMVATTYTWFPYLHIAQEMTYYVLGITLCIVLFTKTKTLKYSFTFLTNNVDRNLLFLSAFLSIYYCILIFVHCFVSEGNDYDDILEFRLRSVTIAFEMIQIIIQTCIIDDSFYRCCDNLIVQKIKPGQNYLAILIGLNFGLWITKSFQLKTGDTFFKKGSPGFQLTNANSLMTFVLYATLPLSILYRYHSSVCLADVYSKIYEGEIRRFEGVLRAEGFKRLSAAFNHNHQSHDKEKNEEGASNHQMSSTQFSGVPGKSVGISANSSHPHVFSRQRSKSLTFLPTTYQANESHNIMRRRRAKPMTRRETIKNLEAAKLRVLSSHLSHNMVSKKLTSTVTPTKLPEETVDSTGSAASVKTISQLVVTDLFSPMKSENFKNNHAHGNGDKKYQRINHTDKHTNHYQTRLANRKKVQISVVEEKDELDEDNNYDDDEKVEEW